MKLVAFTGLAGSGKDTAALALVGWQRASLAAPMKEFCEKLMGWPREWLWGPSELRSSADPELPGVTVRKTLQTLGTEWGRDLVHPDVWARYMLRNLRPDGCYTVTDVRYENEARLIREAGGVIVEIITAQTAALRDVPASVKALDEDWRSHSSEAGLPASVIDATIVNDGTIDDLHAEVRQTVHRLLPGPKPAA